MRFPLLALLSDGPAHGYDLKRRLEEGFGSALPPVNAGQIYTTPQRLERDGILEPTGGTRLKDEFFTKLVVARTTGLADPAELIERQRAEYLRALRGVEELARHENG